MDVLGHVQLANSNRFEPGAGHMDVYAAVEALAASDYDGWLSFECKLSAEPSVELLAEAARRVRSLWESGSLGQRPSQRVV